MSDTNSIKVRVDMTVEVNLHDWRRDYGHESPESIRRAIKASAVEAVEAAVAPDCAKRVTVR